MQVIYSKVFSSFFEIIFFAYISLLPFISSLLKVIIFLIFFVKDESYISTPDLWIIKIFLFNKVIALE